MIHKRKVEIPSSSKVIESYVAPCILCDSDEIKVEEYEDQYGLISTVTCKSCKNEARGNCAESVVIDRWNNENDIPTLLKNKAELIIALKMEISELKLHQKERSRKRKRS